MSLASKKLSGRCMPSKGAGVNSRRYMCNDCALPCRRRLSIMLPIVLVLLLRMLPLLQAKQRYFLNGTSWNNGTLFLLDKKDLAGSFTGYQAFRPVNKTKKIEYTLWFASSDDTAFTLSLLASNLPPNYTGGPSGWIPKSAQVVEGRIIWSANPDRPVGRNATLSGGDGNLVLRDADESLVWAANTSKATSLGMRDDGTLVLLDEHNISVWQSTDHLTDTLMQGQVLQTGRSLRSSLSEVSTSQGPYRLVMEAGGLVSYALLPGTSSEQPYWIWTGTAEDSESLDAVRTTTGGNLSASLCYDDGSRKLLLQLQMNSTTSSEWFRMNYTEMILCNSSAGSASLSLASSNKTAVGETFLRLQPDGDLGVYAWKGKNWTQVYSRFSRDPCRLPMRCGQYGFCSNKGATCECLKDGALVKMENSCSPAINHTTGSCGFKELVGYDYFANSYNGQKVNSSEACKQLCSNCTCKAAFFRKFNASDGGSCFLGWNNVGSIRKVDETTENPKDFQAFLRVPPVSVQRPHKMPVAAIAGGVAAAGLVALLLAGGLALRAVRRSKAAEAEAGGSDVDEEDSMLELSIRSILPAKYSYQDLCVITNDFSEKLGSGAFGSVYKGVLEDGTEVAVKKLENGASNLKEFYAEIASLARNRHWYLVQLLGYSMKRRSRLLVYENMANGSLDAWLFDEDKSRKLSWKLRFNIALGTAKGLAYLHEECSEKIIHLDLKPQNILLDAQFNAKIGDFGLSKLVDREESQVMTMMRGTPGYLAPEWLVEGVISEKVDVFSFGVVLLELITGRKSKELLACGSSKSDLRELALKLQEADFRGTDGQMLTQLVDTNMDISSSPGEEDEFRRAFRVGILCIQDDPGHRPSMSLAVQMLEGTRPIGKLEVQSRSRTFSISKLTESSSSASAYTSSEFSSSAFLKSSEGPPR